MRMRMFSTLIFDSAQIECRTSLFARSHVHTSKRFSSRSPTHPEAGLPVHVARCTERPCSQKPTNQSITRAWAHRSQASATVLNHKFPPATRVQI